MKNSNQDMINRAKRVEGLKRITLILFIITFSAVEIGGIFFAIADYNQYPGAIIAYFVIMTIVTPSLFVSIIMKLNDYANPIKEQNKVNANGAWDEVRYNSRINRFWWWPKRK